MAASHIPTAPLTSGRGLVQRIAPTRRVKRAAARGGWQGITLAVFLATVLYVLAAVAFVLGATWTILVYVVFGVFALPLRLLGRGRRRRKRQQAQHAEVLNAIRESGRGAL